MNITRLTCATAVVALAALLPASGFAQSGDDLMKSRLGTT